jgi:glycosyltransferase involved in cell wall biosynthesis
MGHRAQAVDTSAAYHRIMRVFPRQAMDDTRVPSATAGGTVDPARVLFVHTATRPPLGADTWVHGQIMANLDRSTHEVHAACASGTATQPTPTYEAFRGLPGVRLRPVRLGTERASRSRLARARTALSTVPALFHLVGLAWYVRRNRIAIIHTSDRPRDAAAAVLLGRATGATSIVHAHVGFADWMSPLLRWALRHADVRIAISSFVAQTLDASGHPADRTYVVLNGIDPSQWTPRAGREETRRELEIPQDSPVILTACRLFPSKGPAELISALSAVRGQHPDLRLLIVGKEMVPGFAEELADQAAALGLADNVRLLGHRHDVARLMAAADVFALPSIGEPFGLVYLEAMAMELPVVALASGGAPEVIRHGSTGLLSAPGDLDALADNLSALLSDPGRRTQMGRNGRQRVEATFTSERMAADVAAVYRHILSRTDALENERGHDGITVGC